MHTLNGRAPCKALRAGEQELLRGPIGTAGRGILQVLRCRLDNERMELTGQLSNLSSDLRELLLKA